MPTTPISRVLTSFVVIVLGMLLASCSATAGRLLLHDEHSLLDQARIAEAAAPLIERGAVVGIFVQAQGDANGADFQRRLAAADLLEQDQIAPEVIALYVSFAPRYSELRAGTDWSRHLPDATLRQVRTEVLNPALREHQPTAGLAATLLALEAQLAGPPLLERLQALPGSAVLALVVVSVLVAILFRAPLGDWWRRSPPGRLTQWLGDQTPFGRRRLEQRLKGTQRRLEQRAEYARSWCQAVATRKDNASAAPLLAQLAQLDHERAALQHAKLQDRARERATDQLAWAYERLGSTAARLLPSPPLPARSRRTRSRTSEHTATTSFVDPNLYSASDSSSTWDSGSSSDTSGPSSDGGSW
jgi:uncharacterized membrane protein YgcG